MTTINPEFIQRIKDASNIHEVISGYMSLRRAGVNYKGCCPFHNEKTSSFIVSPTKAMYKCFGCGAGGDVIKFVQEHEQVSFFEAVKTLARRAGVDMPETEMTDDERRRVMEREGLLVLNASVWNTYRQNLMNNQAAMSYVLKRGYGQEIINAFGIGFAENTNQLTAQLSGSQKESARTLSLIKKGDRGDYDQFRNRVMFAFQDVSGNVLGFTGRHIDWKKSDNFPKYLNSDENPLFHKERALFGIFQAKKHIAQTDRAILVEGQGDVVALHQFGLTNTVAGSGTAFSMYQARLIMRFTQNVTLMYDGDAAGRKATLAAIPVLLAEGANLRIINLPEGEDPDSFVLKADKDKIRMQLAAMETDVVEYMHTLHKDELKDVYKKEAALTELGAMLALIENKNIKDDLVRKACKIFGIGIDAFGPKTKPTKEPVNTDTWKDGFHGLEEARELAGNSATVFLTFNYEEFVNNYDSRPYILAKGAISKHHIQEFHSKVKKFRIDLSDYISVSLDGVEIEELKTLKELFRNGIEIEIESTIKDNDDSFSSISGFVDFYVRNYAFLINQNDTTESQKAKYIDLCAEIISCADVTVRTVSMKTWAKNLTLTAADLKAVVQPYLNRKKDKATLESQRLNTEANLLEFDPEKVPSYVNEDENLQQIYQRDRFYPLLKKREDGTTYPVSYMFRNDKGGGHTCISDFYMEPLLHIIHKDSALNKRVLQLNHMHIEPRYVEWQSSFMANLGKLNEKFIEEGSYNFDGSMIQWKAIWRNMSYKFTTCTELRTFGQQPEEFWAFTNAILHDVNGEMKVEYTNHLGVATHKNKNYYSPAFSEIFAHQRHDDDQYELDRFFIYKQVPDTQKINFDRWAKLMDDVYYINDNGKWAVLFTMLACFRDYIFQHVHRFTTLFFIGPTGSGKSQVAESMRSLFMPPTAPKFNLNNGTDAAFFMLLERNKNVLAIMEEYNDNSISVLKFQGLKAAVLDGQGRQKIKDANSKTMDSSKINAVPLPLGQEAPQQDDGSLSNRVILCDVPYNPNGTFSEEEKQRFRDLKNYEEWGLCDVLLQVLSLRKLIKEHFIGIYNEEIKKIQDTIRMGVSNDEGLGRVIESVSMVSAMCRFVESHTELKLPFTYKQFFGIACDKVHKQMETISSSNKLQTYFSTISFLINQESLKIGKELKVVMPGKVTIKKQGNITETIELEPKGMKVLYLDFEAIYPLYHRSTSKEALSRASLRAYFESNKAYIGLCKSTNFIWFDQKANPQKDAEGKLTDKVEYIMDKKTNNTSAYMFNYDMLAELMNVDYERKEAETPATDSNEHIPTTTPEQDLPF